MEKEHTENAIITEYGKSIVNTVKESLLIMDREMKVLFANKSFYVTFHVSEADTEGKSLFALGNGQWNNPELKDMLSDVLPKKMAFDGYIMSHDFPNIGARTMRLSGRKLNDGAEIQAVLLAIEDVTEKQAAEQRWRDSELRYRKLFETAKDGILLIDPPTENIIDANPYLLEMLGYPLEEIVGKKLWEIAAIKDIPATKNIFQELQTKGYVRYEDLPIQSKNGTQHEVEFVSNKYPIGDAEMIQCNIRDITERKIAEEKAAQYMEGLEKLNKMMTGREIKMMELKKEINELKGSIGGTK